MEHRQRRHGRWLALALLGAASLATWLAGARAEEGHESAVEWHKDLAAARALATEQKRPLFVVFRCVP